MRYRVGWLVPGQVMALTHLVPQVTHDDFSHIITLINASVQEAEQPFHMIIDNRIIENEQVVSLDVILQTLPQLHQFPLRHIVMILPTPVARKASTMESQQIGGISLLFVESLAEARAALASRDASINWSLQLEGFFGRDVT